MMPYNECLAEVGFYGMGDAPEPIIEYLAYKKGEIKHFDTEKEAKAFSHLFEFIY